MRIAPIIAFGALALSTSVSVIAPRANAAAPDAKPSIAGTWTIDPLHTSVNFSIRHLGLSEVQGRFADLGGTIVADPANLAKSSVQFTIQATSIDTQIAMRDADLRKKGYFDVDEYPTITFQSTKIVKAAHASGAQYLAHGMLTIKGVPKAVVLPFTINGPILDPWKSPRFGLVSHITIDRTAFGVGDPGAFPIGKDVSISISLEATPAKKPA